MDKKKSEPSLHLVDVPGSSPSQGDSNRQMLPAEQVEARKLNKQSAASTLRTIIDVEPTSLNLLSGPAFSELGTAEDRYVWQVDFASPLNIFGQPSDKFVMKQRGGNVMEFVVEGYMALNALKGEHQHAYGAKVAVDFFLVDYVPHLTQDPFRSVNLAQERPTDDQFIAHMKNSEFFMSYAKQVGASFAKRYAVGASEGNTPLTVLAEDGMPSDVRVVGLRTCFSYALGEDRETAALVEGLNRMLNQGQEADQSAEVLAQAKQAFYQGFQQQYQAMNAAYAAGPAQFEQLVDSMPLLKHGNRGETFLARLNPEITPGDTLVARIRESS